MEIRGEADRKSLSGNLCMSPLSNILKLLPPLLALLLLNGCAALAPEEKIRDLAAYIGEYEGSVIDHQPPVFIVENQVEPNNRIGTPVARLNGAEEEEILVTPDIPTIYAEKRSFRTAKESYTNLIYRIHFPEIPFSLVPFHLGWGKNVGLLVVVTVNREGWPILYTTVQTCGCYLAFIPTSAMPEAAFPDHWNRQRQAVYGETLPGLLDLKAVSPEQAVTLIFLKHATHRIKDIATANADDLKTYPTVKAVVSPLAALESLPLPGGGASSFYESAGDRKGYVKGSSKPWELLLMSWWALDWRIGQDKKLGADAADGSLFYTSLKPWAREASDMRDFPAFLRYWGWNL